MAVDRRAALLTREPADQGRKGRVGGAHVAQGAGAAGADVETDGAWDWLVGGVSTVGVSPATCWQLGVQA